MKYSFIICTYNRAKYLGTCIDSVCMQEFSNSDFEVLVVDNNSTDTTADICKAKQDEYNKVDFNYCLESQQGISYARNKGIDEVNGDYIIYLDDDETIDSDYLQKLDAYLIEYPHAKLIASAVEPVYEVEKPKWLSHFTMRLITGYFNKGDEVKILGAGDYPGTGHTVIKRELYHQFGKYNTDLGRKGKNLMGAEDKDMSFRLIENHIDCYYFPKIKVYHHIPQEKLTSKFFHKLTYSIGKSERVRTLSISKMSFGKRIIHECVKWTASWLLFVFYFISLRPHKGWKLIQFRWNVSRGLLGL